jgi:hypothetical protein
MSYRTRWTILMTIGGLVTGSVVWAVTDSIWWGLVGLLGSGMVFNAIFNPGSHVSR